MKKVFVYGSLKKGFFNHSLIGENPRNKFIRKGFVEGYRLYLLWSYPAIKIGSSDDRVYVELYNLSDEVFERIDRMEKMAGYMPVQVKDDSEEEGFIYVYKGEVDESKFIPFGNWVKQSEKLNIIEEIEDDKK